METWPENATTVKGKDGEVIPGIYIIEGFAKKYTVSISASEMFSRLTQLRSHAIGEPLPNSDDDGEVKWLPGEHPALNYRGHAVKRTKIWLQTDLAGGYRKYGYTGWQWNVARAQRDVSAVPAIEQWLNELNNCCGSLFGFNHVIATLYKDGNDTIGDHSDKTDNWQEGSWFCVIKLGEARPFTIKDLDGNVLFDRALPEGTAVFVSTEANGKVKHGVPPTSNACGPSGSLVFRNIAKVVPWSQVNREINRRLSRKRKEQEVTEEQKEELPPDAKKRAARELSSDSQS